MQAEALSIFPAVNATLNGTAAVLLFQGHRQIIRGRVESHKRWMLAAVASSALFLISYLSYHTLLYLNGHSASKHFAGQGWSRPLYFTILTSHTILAAAIVPLVLITLYRGLKRLDMKHRAIARITYPLWMYVSVTGVIIYFMLYHWFA